jgi:methionyl-tRNA synthetase
VIAAANRYVDAEAPWTLRRTDPERMATVLHTLAEVIRRLALLTQAFMPDASARILDQLGVDEGERSLEHYREETAALRPGVALPKPVGVFPRFAE